MTKGELAYQSYHWLTEFCVCLQFLLHGRNVLLQSFKLGFFVMDTSNRRWKWRLPVVDNGPVRPRRLSTPHRCNAVSPSILATSALYAQGVDISTVLALRERPTMRA